MSRKEREGFLIFHDTLALLGELDAESFKALMLAAGRFSESIGKGEEPEAVQFTGLNKIAYGYLIDGVRYSDGKYHRSAAFNRARRIGVIDPQKQTIKYLAEQGFSTTDIAALKELSEEEVQEVLQRPVIEDSHTRDEKSKIDNLTRELMNNGLIGLHDDIKKQVAVWIDTGKESKIIAAMPYARGMQLSDLISYVNRGV